MGDFVDGAEAGAECVTPVTLELGVGSAHLVFPDADIEKATRAIVVQL
ncbi:aldehyde dehydrogenase family protein [Streptomyces sp. W16]|nr:aldehyde dehydrogenase family protein [Streptomyces sp. W16]MDV9171330.1 aldehyde dehydrogenase family protein [Streptomyces sp. W16]